MKSKSFLNINFIKLIVSNFVCRCSHCTCNHGYFWHRSFTVQCYCHWTADLAVSLAAAVSQFRVYHPVSIRKQHIFTLLHALSDITAVCLLRTWRDLWVPGRIKYAAAGLKGDDPAVARCRLQPWLATFLRLLPRFHTRSILHTLGFTGTLSSAVWTREHHIESPDHKMLTKGLRLLIDKPFTKESDISILKMILNNSFELIYT